MSKSGNDQTSELIREIRTEKANGRIGKRFKDDYFALDLIRVSLYLCHFVDTSDDMLEIRLFTSHPPNKSDS